MGELVYVYGQSGSGKSRSLKNFADDEIFLINCMGKRLPFKGKFKYELVSKNIETIKDQLSKMPCKVAVLDDAGYLMTDKFMSGHSAPKKGSSAFDLYNDIADEYYGLVMFIKFELPEDVIVYVLMHEDEKDNGKVALRTIGRLLDEKVCLEGMSTIVLHCLIRDGKHIFSTQSDGYDIAKSPEEMFDREIENDLKTVDSTIREFWSL